MSEKIFPEKPSLDSLTHYGIKGMKWGVRNDKKRPSDSKKSVSKKNNTPKVDDTSKDPSFWTPEKKRAAAMAAIGVSALLVAGGAAYAVSKSNVKMSDIPKPSPKVDAFLDAKLKQTSVVHATRGKHWGFKFVDKGGLSDPLTLFSEFASSGSGFDQDFAKRDGVVAAKFLDPDGRKDAAGRTIPHEVIIPSSMSDGINSVDDVVKKIWPTLKEDYDRAYPLSIPEVSQFYKEKGVS